MMLSVEMQFVTDIVSQGNETEPKYILFLKSIWKKVMQRQIKNWF